MAQKPQNPNALVKHLIDLLVEIRSRSLLRGEPTTITPEVMREVSLNIPEYLEVISVEIN